MKKNSIPKLELVFLLLLTGMCPQAHATDDGRNASPQKTYAVDLTLGSATVLTFTEAVTSQTGVLFSYESALSQMPLGDVSVHETAAPLEHILEKVFKGRGFRYKVVDRIVVLTYDTDSARSQLVLVTGRVKDGSGMPLVGASVVVKDTMRGVSAGAEGNYRIFADPDATLVFSYIGYADREERIGTRSAIDVVLEEYEAVLEDVVVVGYGTQSRRTVTAAISKFDGHLLEGIPVNSVGDALKGRVPGVRVATTDATPGADPKFLIRGGSSINQSNDPIVLVDGVVREMAGLNPNDIESVSFLKDAAAAGIYGSRASNGVILITTKKGSKHLGPRIVFEGQWAWASPATKFDLMNARDYILTVRPALMEGYCGGMDPASVLGGEQSAGTGNTAKSLWTTRYLRPDEPVPAGYQWVEDPVNPGRIIVFEDNDQQSQWFGDACWQNYYVGIDGGGDNIQYAASAGVTAGACASAAQRNASWRSDSSRAAYLRPVAGSGSTISSPRSPSIISRSPVLTCRMHPATPTSAAMPLFRAMIATWLVTLPCAVTNPATLLKSICAVSEGASSSATTIVPGASPAKGSWAVSPDRMRPIRAHTSRTSSVRPRR